MPVSLCYAESMHQVTCGIVLPQYYIIFNIILTNAEDLVGEPNANPHINCKVKNTSQEFPTRSRVSTDQDTQISSRLSTELQ